MAMSVILTLLLCAALCSAAPLGQEDCSAITYLPFTPKERVCGSDGITYVSREHVLHENCLRGTDVTVVRDGWCDQELEEEEVIKEVLWEFAAEFIKQFKQELQSEGGSVSFMEFLNALFSSSEETHEKEEEVSDVVLKK